jgi:hypothetical protein
MSDESKTKIILELSQNYVESLNYLMELCELKDYGDLAKNALSLFAWVVKSVSEGKEIAAIDNNTQTYNQIYIPALDKARKNANEMGKIDVS